MLCVSYLKVLNGYVNKVSTHSSRSWSPDDSTVVIASKQVLPMRIL